MTAYDIDPAVLAWLDQEDRHVSEVIRKHGCYLEYVGGEADTPSFAYTIGLFGIGHPELIVFGLGMSDAARTLNYFFDLVRCGNDLTPGQIITPPGARSDFLVEVFPEPGGTLFSANRHYRRPSEASVPAYQVTWSIDGCFPWDPGYRLPGTVQPRPGTFRADSIEWRD
jgi:hypothetical protein